MSTSPSDNHKNQNNRPNTHGGARPGAGNPSPYGEPTKVMRIPQSQVAFIKNILQHSKHNSAGLSDLQKTLPVQAVQNDEDFFPLPRSQSGVAAGPVSFVEQQSIVSDVLDLNLMFGPNPGSRFAIHVTSESMLDAGIAVNDILAVNRSVQARHGDIVIARINGEFTVKRLMIERTTTGERRWLKAENPDYQNIYFREGESFEVWGVVMGCLKRFRGK